MKTAMVVLLLKHDVTALEYLCDLHRSNHIIADNVFGGCTTLNDTPGSSKLEKERYELKFEALKI